MTKCEQDILFELLRAAIWQRKADLSAYAVQGEWKWKNILKAADMHGMIGVIADVVMSLPDDFKPGMKSQAGLIQYVAALTQATYKNKEATVVIFKALQEKGLHPVLMKGPVIAAFYPERVYRSSGDIDIYLTPSEYEEGCNIVNELCGCKDKSEGIFEDRVHYHVSYSSSVEVEVHRRVGETPDPERFGSFNNWADDMLKPENCKTMDILGYNIRIPSDCFTIIFNYQHLAKHFSSKGIGLRQFVDWALIMHSYKDAPDELWQQVKKDMSVHIRKKPWQILQGILVYQFGLPKEECLYWDEKKAKKSQGELLEYIIDSGNFGENMSWSDIIKNMERGSNRTFTALKYLFGHTFMLSKVSVKWAYNYLSFIVRTGIENKIKKQ